MYSVELFLSTWVCMHTHVFCVSQTALSYSICRLVRGCVKDTKILMKLRWCAHSWHLPSVSCILYVSYHKNLDLSARSLSYEAWKFVCLWDLASSVLSSVVLLFIKLMHLTEVVMAMMEKVKNLLMPRNYWRFCISRNMKPTLSTLYQVTSNRSNCIFINEWVHFK